MTQTFDIIKLSFTGPLHLSKGKNDYDSSEVMVHSDTLKSALFSCAIQLFGEEDIDRGFLDAFQVSSTFPYVGEQLFFPKPLKDLYLFEDVNDDNLKAVKKIAYLSQGAFEKVINGAKLKYKQSGTKNKSAFYADGDAVPESLFQSSVAQRVSLLRFQEDSSKNRLFYMDKLYFKKGAGLYFILDIKEESYRHKIESALKLLKDNGLGTDRNIGQGQFKSTKESLTLNIPDTATECLSLSLFCPLNESNLPSITGSSYKLKKRGGWISSPSNDSHAGLRKRSVYMFEEGSVFPAKKGADWKGAIVDLKPGKLPPEIKLQHSIWRDGTPFFIPVNLPKSN